MKKIAVIQFPGSNCERESILALKRNGLDPVPFLWNQDYQDLEACDGYFIVGGFSYEDRSRAGVIASLDPVVRVLKRESEKGKPVLGICNGAQVLVETGLVPGAEDYVLAMALDANRRMQAGQVTGTGFYNGWVDVKMTSLARRCAFTRNFDAGEQMHIPVAHAEGRFVIPPQVLEQLRENDQLPFIYVDTNGVARPDFPVNPNGSVENLAAVCNSAGNVMAMMPHPERTPKGDKIFSSMRDYLTSSPSGVHTRMSLPAPEFELNDYNPPEDAHEYVVDLIITDNEAVSVEQTLQRLGFAVKVHRQTHWELLFDSPPDETVQRELVDSGELFNSNKEILAEKRPARTGQYQILVRHREGGVGEHKHKALRDWFGIKSLNRVKRGVLWTLEITGEENPQTLTEILNTHIFFNPFAHDAFWYGRADVSGE
ncbi:MAG: phosphoribosylformylglycinamidine synthase I [Candidatus Marinimicrobia bacterium]|nr:phosphoribosylformylglycinamidine synthase I [Candidatus Neomarinimicrobiota bacterium]MCF7840033.1 phosphoribosylformylglycinamidine synthase I [Candidatus Neomarinimicrobiota bacterium]